MFSKILVLLVIVLFFVTLESTAEKNGIQKNSRDNVIKEVYIKFNDASESVQPRALLEIASMAVLFSKCKCYLQNLTCECCFSLTLIIEKSCCFRMQYSKNESALTGNLTIGNISLLNYHIVATQSSSKTPPQCITAPLPVAVGICLQFYGIVWNRKTLSMCSRFRLSLLKRSVYNSDFGCFDIGAGKAISKMAKALTGEPDTVNVKMSNKEVIQLTKCFLKAERGQLNGPCL